MKAQAKASKASNGEAGVSADHGAPPVAKAGAKAGEKAKAKAQREQNSSGGGMQRFMVRAGDASGAPPGTAAQTLHESIGNNPKESLPQPTPAILPPATKTKSAGPQCYKCNCNKEASQGFYTGRGKKLFVCSACNALEGRLCRLMKGKAISLLWRDMSAEDKVSWRSEHNQLEAAALADGLTISFAQRVRNMDKTAAGSHGEFLPLCVYASRGYNKAWLDWIEATANSQTEAQGLKTYSLRVKFETEENIQEEIQTSLWKPIKESRLTENHVEENSDSSDSSSGTSEEGKGAQKKKHKKKSKRNKDKEASTHRRLQLKVANRIMDKASPIAQQLSTCQDRLSAEIKDEIPPYQLLDMQQHKKVIEEVMMEWGRVVKGSATMADMATPEDVAERKILQAKNAAAAFKVSLAGAEQIVDAMKMKEEPNKKKKKGGKKESGE